MGAFWSLCVAFLSPGCGAGPVLEEGLIPPSHKVGLRIYLQPAPTQEGEEVRGFFLGLSAGFGKGSSF